MKLFYILLVIALTGCSTLNGNNSRLQESSMYLLFTFDYENKTFSPCKGVPFEENKAFISEIVSKSKTSCDTVAIAQNDKSKDILMVLKQSTVEDVTRECVLLEDQALDLGLKIKQ